MNLRSKLVTMTVLPVLLATVLVGSLLLAVRIHDINALGVQQQQMVLDSYVAQLAVTDDPVAHQQLLRQLLEVNNVRAAQLRDQRRPLLHVGPQLRPSHQGQRFGEERRETDHSWQWQRALNDHQERFLVVEFSRLDQQRKILESIILLLAFILIMLLISTVPIFLFSRHVSHPLNRLLVVLRRIRDGDTNVRLPAQGYGEISHINRAMNEMIAAIEEQQKELQGSVDHATQDLQETLDTIEIQNIELDLARKEALKTSQIKSQFLANMSHEIRTPLNAILGFTRLLGQSALNHRQRDYLDTIRKSSDSLLAIINDILDFSKIEAGKLSLEQRPLNLHDLVEDVQMLLAPLAQERGLEQAAIVYADVPPDLVADPLRIRQVLTNLVSNGLKFTEQGSVVVRVMLEKQQGKMVTVRLAVTDTGPGLSKKNQRELFNAFEQADASISRQASGTGLGLSICKQLAQAMGGDIGVESELGQGATFWFTVKATIDERGLAKQFNPDLNKLDVTRVRLYDANEHTRLSLLHTLQRWSLLVNSYGTLEELTTALHQDSHAGSTAVIVGLPSDMTTPPRALLQLLDSCTANQLRTLLFCDTPEHLFEELKAYPQCLIGSKPITRSRLFNALTGLSQTSPAVETDVPRTSDQYADLNVLVVDDNHANAKLAKVLLEQLGCRVVVHHDGQSALDYLHQHTVDLVFMDIQMPIMDGKSATRLWRERESSDRHLPIIALTAHALENERRELIESGLDDYLCKPITIEQLDHTLSVWCTSKVNTPPVAAATNTYLPSYSEDPIDLPIWCRSLALQRTGNRTSLAFELHQQLVAQLPTLRQSILEAVHNGTAEKLQEIVHTLNGSSQYCGVRQLQAAAHQLETRLKSSASRHLELDAESKSLLTAIDALLNMTPLTADDFAISDP